MIFRKYCSNATCFDAQNLAEDAQSYDKLLMGMILCHSVQVTKGDINRNADLNTDVKGIQGRFNYVASSPEEKATLEVLAESGYEFLGTEPSGRINVRIKGRRRTYIRLAELPFDSYRKCMTVIIKETHNDASSSSSSRNKHETIHVFTKGAECVILPACVTPQSGANAMVHQTKIIVDNYASDGLRTLVYAYKQLTRTEFESFASQLEQAKQSIVNRVKFMRDVYHQIESRGMSLLGVTAIEDKLQEGVAETIEKLGRAGITTWMVTGDKKETAVNLGHASGK